MKRPRLPIIAGVTADDNMIAQDQFDHITKTQLCELYYHLYQDTHGQVAGTFIVEDIRS